MGHDPVSCSPKRATPTPMKIAAWTAAMATLTAIRARTTAQVGIGASRRRRSRPFLRHTTRLVAAPNVAPEAIAQPISPGVKNWIVDNESSSTWSDSRTNFGCCPVTSMLADCTIAWNVPWTVAALT